MSQAETPPTPDFRTDDYDIMLEQVDTAIDELIYKIEDGRIRDPETEKTRCKQYRTLGYLVRTKQQVLKDRKLIEYAEILDSLESNSDIDL